MTHQLQTTYHVQCTCQETLSGELVTLQHSHGLDNHAEVLVCPKCKVQVVLSVHTDIKKT